MSGRPTRVKVAYYGLCLIDAAVSVLMIVAVVVRARADLSLAIVLAAFVVVTWMAGALVDEIDRLTAELDEMSRSGT